MDNDEMYVLKRNGDKQIVSFDKILSRVQNLGQEANISIPYTSLVMKVIDQLYNGIKTTEIDELTAQQCASMQTLHPDYEVLAARILVSNHQKNTDSCFLEVVEKLYNFRDVHNEPKPLVSKNLYDIVKEHKDEINNMIDFSRDFDFDYFGFKTLERAYLMRINKKIVERPQHMWMRVAIQIHGKNLESVRQTYDYMSCKYFTHATPTLFNAGTTRPQLSSCYLIGMEDDSIDGIYNTLGDCARISKWAGGIGLHIHNVRASGTHIRGTNGTSNGIIPMLKVFNNTARYVDQGGGKRNGSFAIYLEPWHADIEDFLSLKKNHGDEEMRARDLFYAVWIPDLFMRRVKTNKKWTLLCPDECPGLADVYGDEFDKLYESYEKANKGKFQINARDLWFKILDSQIETGTPYILFKDACNKKSNQKNLGTIKSSNLCTEIVEYSDKNETAVCNLASIGLAKFVKSPKYTVEQLKSNDKSIKIYSKTKCNFCKKLKTFLDEKSITYEEILLDDDKERQRFYQTISMKEKKTIKTVPQIYRTLDNGVNWEHIGGYDNFMNGFQIGYDYDKLHEITKVVAGNLDKIIDCNFYPTEKTRRSNFMHRPIGIGVQGLADTFALMKIPFHSEQARVVNKNIFETIYHASLEKSNEIAKERIEGMKQLINLTFTSDEPDSRDYDKTTEWFKANFQNISKYLDELKPTKNEIITARAIISSLSKSQVYGSYSTFCGSPASEGILQFDMWNVKPSSRYDWTGLKKNIMTYGLRNSLSLAPMPTASTSQILGNNECFEPFTSHIYSRRTIAGDYIIANKYLLRDLISRNLWSESIKDSIIANGGSIQHLEQIPKDVREQYKIVWEIPMKQLIDMAADRGAFICQSQSLNLWLEDPTYKSLTSMHFYSWEKGLKTGIYYLRRKPRAAPQQFTIDPSKTNNENNDDKKNEGNVAEPEEPCEMCSA